MGICVSIWTPNQVKWPRPIRSELHVESLKRPKHAVHDEWLGTLLMTRIKNYSIQYPQLLCNLYLVKILLLGIEFLCIKKAYCIHGHIPYKLCSMCHGG